MYRHGCILVSIGVFSWKFTKYTPHKFCTNDIILDAISQQSRALFMKSNVHSRLYRRFNRGYFHENLLNALSANSIQKCKFGSDGLIFKGIVLENNFTHLAVSRCPLEKNVLKTSYTFHSTHIRDKRCTFDCNQSIIKGTFFKELYTLYINLIGSVNN
jgi:hypothetical protein